MSRNMTTCLKKNNKVDKGEKMPTIKAVKGNKSQKSQLCPILGMKNQANYHAAFSSAKNSKTLEKMNKDSPIKGQTTSTIPAFANAGI